MGNVDNEKNLDEATPLFSKWGVYDNNHGGDVPIHVASGGKE